MIYNFDLKPDRKFVRDVCAGLERHIDKYMLTDRPDRSTKIYTSSVNGKTAVVRFSRKGVSVESENDLSEYFNRHFNANYRKTNRAQWLAAVFISLAFCVINANALMLDFVDISLLPIAYFVLFFLTFKPIYKITDDVLHTAFIQSGGIFTVLHIPFLIAHTVCYTVKNGFPNISDMEIRDISWHYNAISWLMTIQILGYLFVLLPWFISFIFYCIFPPHFYAKNRDLKKSRQ